MHRISPKILKISEQELLDFCQRFPELPLEGYRRYLQEYGGGIYCDFIRIFPPDYCLSVLKEQREMYAEFDFWDDGADVLTQAELAESVPLGNSVDGDALLAHPKSLDRLFIAPRHDNRIYWTPASLAEPMHWMSSRGAKLITPKTLGKGWNN